MDPFVWFFKQMVFPLFNVLYSIKFTFGVAPTMVTVSLGDVVFAGIVVSMVTGVFWKGARG